HLLDYDYARTGPGQEGVNQVPVEMIITFRRDLSDNSAWRIGELRFALIREMRTPVSTSGTVFQAPDGRAFAFAAAATREEVDRFTAAMGGGARLFGVRLQWSLPNDDWVSRNPELWKR